MLCSVPHCPLPAAHRVQWSGLEQGVVGSPSTEVLQNSGDVALTEGRVCGHGGVGLDLGS